MFRSIKPAIREFALRPEVQLKLQEQQLKTIWQELVWSVNKNAVGKSEVSSLHSKELVVKTVNHIWLQELFFYRETLKKKTRERFRDIESIRFVI